MSHLQKWIDGLRIPQGVFDILVDRGIQTLPALADSDINEILRAIESILNPLQKKRFINSFNELRPNNTSNNELQLWTSKFRYDFIYLAASNDHNYLFRIKD
jgi:hypothetical protein